MTTLQSRHAAISRPRRDRGFTLIELLVTMAITTVILGATMAAMNDAIKATESATQITEMNNGLRTAMDLMVRDMLQVGQGLPSGRAIVLPNGANSTPMQLPGPAGSNYQLDGPSFCPPRTDDPDTLCEEITAVIPGPERGPVIVADQPPTDMVTTLAADSSFESIPLRAFAADGRSITVPRPGVTVTGASDPLHPNGHVIADDPDVAGDNIRPGDLIMLTKGSSSALVQVSSVTGPGVSPQVITFAANDSLNLNQSTAADGTSGELRNSAPIDTLSGSAQFVSTQATKIRMISYYIDAVTDPLRPRLVRRMNNGSWNDFDNSGGTAVAFDIEGLQITYDLADGLNNPSNVRMTDADLTASGPCAPSACYSNQIRKINIVLSGRSRLPRRGTQQYFRNRLVTQVSLRSLAFVDRYK
jgi:prepilin-type N-terminal cleavage/methylation domain-containing protein